MGQSTQTLSGPQQLIAGQLITYLKLQDSLYESHQGTPWVRRILQGGAIFTPASASQQPQRGEPNQCYYNSFRSAVKDQRIYCEGWAVPDLEDLAGFPVMHGWLLNTDGQVLETTWERPGVIYLGLPVKQAWHIAWGAQYRTACLSFLINPAIEEPPSPRPDWVHPVVEKGIPL